jgi:hypothetical protein
MGASASDIKRGLLPTALAGNVEEKKQVRTSFFEKKKQKNFAPLRACMAPSPSPRGNQSFFCFFFVHKKEDSSS